MVDPVDPLHFTTPYLWITVYRQTCRIFKLRHEKYPGTKNPHFVVFSEIWGLSGYDSGFWPFVFFYNSVGKITNIWKFETTQFQLLPPQKTHHKHTENEPPASEHLADSILWVKNPEGLEGPKKHGSGSIALKSMAVFMENYCKNGGTWYWALRILIGWECYIGEKDPIASNVCKAFTIIHQFNLLLLAKEILYQIVLENCIPYLTSKYIYDIFK